MIMKLLKSTLALALIVLPMIMNANEMSDAESSSELKQKISIYGWLPTMDGTFIFDVPGEGDESADANVIDSLDAVFMGSYALRKNEWSFLADLIYLKISGETQGMINPNVTYDLELTTKLFSFYGGYNLIHTDKNDLNIIAGMRYMGLGLDVTRSGGRVLNGTLSPSLDSYDAVIGLSGEYEINQNWYIPYQFDIGAGDSDLTWQANASIAYRFSWGDIIGTYRYMHYDKGALLAKDFKLYGPKLGVVFHF